MSTDRFVPGSKYKARAKVFDKGYRFDMVAAAGSWFPNKGEIIRFLRYTGESGVVFEGESGDKTYTLNKTAASEMLEEV